jgi:hypothetical protein
MSRDALLERSADGSSPSIWRTVLDAVAQRIGPHSFDTWFGPLACVAADSTSLRLRAPSELFKTWFLDSYAQILEDVIAEVVGEPRHVEVFIEPPPDHLDSDATESHSLPVVRACSLQAETNTRQQWLIENLWTAQAVGALGGSPKAGKTWLALEMAVSVASGTPCLETFHVHTPGTVLLYVAEDSPAALRSRLVCLAHRRGITLGGLDVRVITADSLRLDRNDDQDKLSATVAVHRPVLLVLDPLIRVHAVDENASGPMAALLGYFRTLQRRTGVAIVLVHHVRKNVSGTTAGYSLRGSGDLYAWLDSFLYLRRHRDHLMLSAEHRSAPAFGPLTLELATDPSPHLRPISKTDPEPDEDPVRLRIEQVLSESPRPLSADALRADVHARNDRVLQALRALCAEGKVIRSPQGYAAARPSAAP